MPIPKPKADETQDDFIARCMGNDTMKEEFPDNDQRLAVCFQKWKDKDKKDFMGNIERRVFLDTEMRIDEEGDGNSLIGYAAVFNRYSEDLGFFKEKIKKGAFSKTIKENDIRALINHNPDLVLGRTKNKTLKLWEDDTGLGYEVKLPDTSYALDLKESIRRKDITQNSFGFQTIQDKWSTDGKRRELLEAKLFDVSPVTFPAYPQTSVKLRLHEIGIDYDALNMALIRASRDVITDSDIDMIQSTIKILRQYIPIEDEPLAEGVDAPEHSPADEEPELASTLIRLRLTDMKIRKYIAGDKS